LAPDAASASQLVQVFLFPTACALRLASLTNALTLGAHKTHLKAAFGKPRALPADLLACSTISRYLQENSAWLRNDGC
jgi:hypothetical protein